MKNTFTLTAITIIIVLSKTLWGDFNPSSGFLGKPIQRDTEVEFNYVSTYNGLNMTATSPYGIEIKHNLLNIRTNGKYCWEFWFKLDSINKQNPLFEQINKISYTRFSGYTIGISEENRIVYENYSDKSIFEVQSSTTLSDSIWYYLVINQKGENDIEIILNGKVDYSISDYKDAIYDSFDNGTFLGMSLIYDSFFTGKIAEFSLAQRNIHKQNNENTAYISYYPYPQHLFHFDTTDSIITDYGKYNANGHFIGNPDSLNNAFFSDKPNFYEWDINADGVFDTTTMEQTLVYDFGTFDTTQVIVKAVFDSLTFTIDTTQIALFENIISLNYDTLWVCTLATENFNVLNHPFSVSDSGEAAAVRMKSTTGGCNAHYLIHNGMSYLADTTHSVSVLHNGTGFLVADIYVDSTWVDCNASGVSKYDTLFNRIQFWGAASGLLAPSENDSIYFIYGGVDKTSMNDGSMYSSEYFAIRDSDTTVIYSNNNLSEPMPGKDISFSPDLKYFFTSIISQEYIFCINTLGDTLWENRNFPSISIDTMHYFGNLIQNTNNNTVYAMIGYSKHLMNPYEFDLMLIQYDSLGNQNWVHTFNSVNTGKLKISNDGKYMFGLSDYHHDKKRCFTAWELETFTNLFYNTIIPNRSFRISSYDIISQNDKTLFYAVINDEYCIVFNENGNEMLLPNPKRIFYTEKSNLAYEKDENRLIMYRVEWE